MLPLRLLVPGINLLVALLFLTLTWSLYPMLSLAPDPGEFIARVHRSLGHPGAPELGWLPPGARVSRYSSDRPPEVLWGSPIDPDPAAMARAWSGVESHLVVGQRLTVWQPSLDSRGRVDEVAVAEVPLPPRGLDRRMGRLANLEAALVASGVCLLISMVLSLRVTRPIQQLSEAIAALERGDLESRVTVTGPRDLRELSLAYNRMAQRLQVTLEGLRRAKERAEQSEQHHRDFMADISHSLGTPLAAVQGWVHAMQDGIIQPEAYSLHFAKISRETAFVSRAVKRLLELSRWETGRPEILLSQFALLDPALEAVESLEDALLARGMELNFAGLDGSVRVKADRGRVRELFQILLENCVAHAGEGTSVSLVVESQGGRALVCVADNGRGIAAEDLPRVTHRFYRCGSGGTGLGLSIAERLAQAHGGELRMVSRPGQGTRAFFSLKLA